MKESWSAPGDPDVLRREFAGWDPRIGTLLRQVQTTFRWALYDREPLPTWTRGRLTLLGDAAHPMLPHLGQGANQSIEDGMALATILARTDRASVPAALLAYERLRRERVAQVQRGARENGLRYDSVLRRPRRPRRRDRRARRVPQAALRSRRRAGSASRGGCLELNEHYITTIVNRAITLSSVGVCSCARPKFRAFLVHAAQMRRFCRVNLQLPADHVDRSYTQSVWSPFFSGAA